jgi:phosphohistidine swiveling domain-containing protein
MTKWEVLGGDSESTVLRHYLWGKIGIRYVDIMGVPQPFILLASEGSKLTYYYKYNHWMKTHNALKKLCLADDHYLENLIEKTVDYGEEFMQWLEVNIQNADVSLLSNKQIMDLINLFCEKQGILYVYGVALPILDFGGFTFIESNLTKYLHKKVSEIDFAEYYRVFTAPTRNSYALDQEIALLHLMSNYYDDTNWREHILTSNPLQIEHLYSKFWEELKVHAKNHGWVYYAFSGPAFNEMQFLDFIKDYLIKKVHPVSRLKEIDDLQREIMETKEKYIHKLKPDPFNLMILHLAGRVVWAKPRRKDYQSKAYWHIEKVMWEVAKRLDLSLRQERSMTPAMIEKALKKGKVDKQLLDSIYETNVVLPETKSTKAKLLYGDKAKKFIEELKLNATEIKIEQFVSEIKGNSACRGRARGNVKIVDYVSDIGKMNYGDILVSRATNPSLVAAMKRAAAIITDEGGLTCHASIVSRELNIPCVVGTKIATKILKDGDLIEVDAGKGLVKRITL